MLQVKTLDFSGQPIYCGIDVHKRSWSVCLRSGERELRTFSQNPDPELLVRHLKSNYPNASILIGYEAGFSGYWAYRAFTTQGLQCRLIHASDIPQPDKNRRYKTDRIDCRKLAIELSKGFLNYIHIPSELTIQSRSLVRTRDQLVRDQTRYKNRISAMLTFFGIAIPEGYKNSTHFSKRFLSWLQGLPLAQSPKTALQIKLGVLHAIRQQLLLINKELRALAQSPQYAPVIKVLMSIPGIGIHTALIIATELEDIHRFKSLDHLAGYVGFKPDVYSSAEKMVVKGITRHCHHRLREALVEAAWMAVGKDPALTMAYQDYKKRMHYNKAILRIAKKLLARIRYVLLHNTPYQMALVG